MKMGKIDILQEEIFDDIYIIHKETKVLEAV